MMTYENIKEKTVHSLGTTYEAHNGLAIHVERKGNDVNGNPLYRVSASIASFSEMSWHNFYRRDDIKEFTYRRYPAKKYVLVQSYNIEDTINRMLGKLTSLREYYYPRS